MRRAAALIAIALLAAACTGSAPDVPSGALPSLDTPPGTPTGDRLLVLMSDGSVVTTGRDGSDEIALLRNEGLDIEARHPVWSPDGRSIAWAELGTGGPAATSRLITSRPDGSGRTELPVDTGMFFLEWDPTSSRIAYLGSFQGAIGMGVADPGAAGGPVSKTLGVGQPFYLSWSPEGDRLLIHVGDATLGTLDLQGNLRPVGDSPGLFHAPVWLADGRLVYAMTIGTRQALVVRDGGEPRELVRFRGAIEFVVSPDGSRIAYRIDAPGEGLGSVAILDVRSTRSRPVTDAATSAFHWSPDGRRLLLMTPVEGTDPTTHRWQVWDGNRTSPIGPPFVPSPTYLRDYVPFFGQFAQTMTLWSPDGRSFAFPGLIDDRAGIWVQDLDADRPTFAVEDGSVVAWSPVAE
jgi:Tol biopolymer transport system component